MDVGRVRRRREEGKSEKWDRVRWRGTGMGGMVWGIKDGRLKNGKRKDDVGKGGKVTELNINKYNNYHYYQYYLYYQNY